MGHYSRNNNTLQSYGSSEAMRMSAMAAAAAALASAQSTNNQTSSVQKNLLDIMRKQVESNLAHSEPGKCPLTKREIFDLGQLQQEMMFEDGVHSYGINVRQLYHNSPAGVLYEEALKNEKETYISSTGALCCSSGEKTGRSPADKRIVNESKACDIWWGKVNMPMCETSYLINRERALDYLNLQNQLFVVDAFAGWDKEYQVKVRVITSRAYHALFMKNMLVKPTAEEQLNFSPDFVIYNAGCFPANRFTRDVSSQTSVSLNFGRGEMVILGTQYAGEMKKGILTLMMYLMPQRAQLPLHSSCNVGKEGDVTLFFGLSGTGKTTLSADPSRDLIGDDEHVWTDKGVFNIEGGCYAKCKDLSREQEPEIYDAIRFGAVLENVMLDEQSRTVDYNDVRITENTRCAYPLEYIPNAKIPAFVNTHPTNIILLTCDAFGVLPPVSKLSAELTMYHFISGYTSKMAGTEQGILEPTATFSSCFGAPFLAMHPMVYAEMLAKKLVKHNADSWLVNTGWTGGRYGSNEGRRIPLKYTRSIVNAIHDGSLAKAEFEKMEIFNLPVPKEIEGVPSDVLMPSRCWSNSKDLDTYTHKLATLFLDNFKQFHEKATPEVLAAGPQINS